MKIKAVVFNVHSQRLALGKREDEPQRWFRDRGILLVQIWSSFPPDVLAIDQVLERYEGLRFFEETLFAHADILVVSDDQEFLRWTKERGFQTITPSNIDDIIYRILVIEHRKDT